MILPAAKGVENIMEKCLRTIWNDDEFVFCTRAMLKTDDERQEIINGIENKELQSSEDVVLYVNQICEDRGKH